ncbi:MAG: RdgB/HAM1 family non-canonical purine NTP pyrophosphatase [Stenotrophomonas sp.]
MKQLVLASGNAGKLAEFNRLLAAAGIEVVTQQSLGVDDTEETGLSFVENALLKARHAARHTGLPALSDDSGLCVDALGGAPGLYSARYAGTHGDHAANIAKLLGELDGLPAEQRGAHFHCTLVLVAHADDPDPLIAQGRWHGRILDAPRGTGGFGYDPVFLDPAHGQSAAEMPAELKSAVSHRAQALTMLRSALAA